METISFLVESSLGELNVRLLADGWTAIEFSEPTEDHLIVENIVRNQADLAACFTTLEIPEEEAAELAEELWAELDATEQAERSRTPGPR